jgi:hypothetical protein
VPKSCEEKPNTVFPWGRVGMIPERPVGHRDSTTVRRRDEPAGEQAVSGSDPIVFVVEDDASVREALESLSDR